MRDKYISGFVAGQLSKWKLAADNFKALDNVCVREVEVNGLTVKLQFNPARMISSAAKLSKEDIAKRRCFLCEENRPSEQDHIPFESGGGHLYHILVNPYPIFRNHLVIAVDGHHDQSIIGRYEDMLQLAGGHGDCSFFYNGPCCGASAPDHHHFQAAPRGIMPLEKSVDAGLSAGQDARLTEICSHAGVALYKYNAFANGIFVIASDSPESMSRMFYRLMDCAEIPDGDIEPRINLYTWFTGNEYHTVVFFRKCHRSHHYFSEGPDHLTMSPGCADMAGVFIVPVESEYHRITPEILSEMIGEITISEDEQRRIISRMTRTQPLLNVGIMAAREMEFEIFEDGLGPRKAVLSGGKIEYGGKLYDELYFEAADSPSIFAQPSFALHDVTIGVDFHWERKESQKFAGALKIIVDGEVLRAINVVGVEDYLLSVISSEMRATASEEFLKAHAVISRSWVMTRISAGVEELSCAPSGCKVSTDEDVHEYVKWYDHEDHTLFDVCADDHCQRYQGLTRATGETVRKVIDCTWGEVLKYDDMLCDARFSKCCGGLMEKFSTCWEDNDYPYLQPVADAPGHDPDAECFCNTSNREVLSQVLNDYDLETQDFYRWTVEYDSVELGRLIEKKSGVRIGRVMGIEPLERGDSGRISRLRVIGEEKTMIVGKELEIRRILSESHLKSSAFEVEYTTKDGVVVSKDEDWKRIRLNGKGWGHGVGLCQIGAAVMATRGYTYREILQHYYPGAVLCR